MYGTPPATSVPTANKGFCKKVTNSASTTRNGLEVGHIALNARKGCLDKWNPSQVQLAHASMLMKTGTA